MRSGHQSRIRNEPVMQEGITFVGLDVHKESINVAMLLPGEARPVEWHTSNDPAAVRRQVRKLQRSKSEICSCATRRARAATRCSARFARWTCR